MIADLDTAFTPVAPKVSTVPEAHNYLPLLYYLGHRILY